MFGLPGHWIQDPIPVHSITFILSSHHYDHSQCQHNCLFIF